MWHTIVLKEKPWMSKLLRELVMTRLLIYGRTHRSLWIQADDRLPNVNAQTMEWLIDEENGTWNMNRLQDNFIGLDVCAICSIPLGRFMEDMWSWSKEKSGLFTIRSAYRALMERSWQQRQASSSRGGTFSKENFGTCQFLTRFGTFCGGGSISFCRTCGKNWPMWRIRSRGNYIPRMFWVLMGSHILARVEGVASTKIPQLHPKSWVKDLVDDVKVRSADTYIISCECGQYGQKDTWDGMVNRDDRSWHQWKWEVDTTRISMDMASMRRRSNLSWSRDGSPQKLKKERSIEMRVFMKMIFSGSTTMVMSDRTGSMICAEAIWYEYATDLRRCDLRRFEVWIG